MRKFRQKTHCINQETDDLKDITDGAIYQKFLLKRKDKRPSDIFTFLLNTDGIKICNKSDLSIWPIYLVINEIPIQYRFCVNNVIIAGLSVANSKPNINIYLQPIIDELAMLEYGIDLSYDKNEKI